MSPDRRHIEHCRGWRDAIAGEAGAMDRIEFTIATAAAALLVAPAAAAQEDSAQLAKQLSNPVASLISVPFQQNIDCCVGPADAARYTLVVQPVIPVSLNSDWNVIVRTIVPVIYQSDPTGASHDSLGFGDTTQSFFFSPKKVDNGLVWAVGPVFSWPTGTSDLGSNSWGAGPTALVLKLSGPVTYGMLVNQIWSYAGPAGAPRLSVGFLQPFINYTWPNSTGVTLNSETSYDWKSQQWTVPFNLSVSHVYKVGGQPVSLSLTGRVQPVSANDGPGWGVRLTTTFLFPKRK